MSTAFVTELVGMRTYLKRAENVVSRTERTSAASERGRRARRRVRICGYEGVTVVRRSWASFWKRLPEVSHT